MTLLLFVRSFSFVNIFYFFPSVKVRSEISEFYVVVWAAILVTLLWNPIAYLPLLYALLIYRLIDGVNYRLCIIFIDRYMPSWGLRSLNRSFILLGINYFEIILAFAILYLHTQSVGSTISGLYTVSTPAEALYFSSMTILTLSFGDFKPLTPIGKMLVVLEPILGVLLIVLVVGVFLTGMRDIREKSL
ncbi:ion channel, partial [Chloroflexota bacterium]